MKKKIFLCLLCGVLLLGVTGCGSTKEINHNQTSSNKEEEKEEFPDGYDVKEVLSFRNGYGWLELYNSDDRIRNYTLVDTNGKVIYGLSSISESNTTAVYNDYFIYALSSDEKTLIHVKDGELFKTGDVFEPLQNEKKYIIQNMILTTDSKVYITLSSDDYDAEKKYVLYDLNSKNIEEVDSSYKVENMAKTCIDDDFPEFTIIDGSYISQDGYYYVDSNNGYFSVFSSDDNKMFDPIKGEVVAVDGENKTILALIDEDYYMVDINGNKELIDLSDTELNGIYQDIVYNCESNFNGGDCDLYNINGKTFKLHK